MAYPSNAPAPVSGNLPMSKDEVREWWARVEADRNRRKKESDNWRELLLQYLPRKAGGKPWINSNIHFRNAALKAAEIWAQMPELILAPLMGLPALPDPATGAAMNPADIIAVKRAVLMKLLGRDHADVDLTIREVLFDIFMTSGIGFTKICYEADTVAPPEPMEQPGAVLGLSQPMAAPVVVNERLRWYRFSSEKAIVPADWYSTRWDEAPYLGMEFVEPLTPASLKKYNLPPNFQSNVTRDDMILNPERDQRGTSQSKLLRGVELWPYAAYFDPTVANQQVMRRLVLIEGQKDQAAVYVASPYHPVQEDGRLRHDSMIGSPIHPMGIRVAADTAWVPSDAAFTDPLVRIENSMMAQDLAMRDANLPRFVHAVSLTAAINKLKDVDTGQGAAVADDVLARGMERLLVPLPKLEHAQSDESMRQHVSRAQEGTLGVSPNQAGAQTNTVRSATESAIVQQNVSVRLKNEQSILVNRFLAGVRKFDALIQQFWDAQDYISIAGPDGAQKLVQYNAAMLQGRYAFDCYPDSQLTLDNESRIAHFKDFVNFMAKSGWLNLGAVGTEWVNLMGYGGKGLIQQPQPPPPPPPDHPKTSIALTDASLGIPEVRELLRVLGVDLTQMPLSPELQAAMQREAEKNQHGGAVDKVDLVEKHSSEQTGNQPGKPPVAPAQPMPAAMPPPPQRPQ